MRFLENQSVVDWLLGWKQEGDEDEGMTATAQSRRFISRKTYFDVLSMVHGFRAFCSIMFGLFEDLHIKTYQTSQDYLELFFACQRAQNGQNNNPSVLQYGKIT